MSNPATRDEWVAACAARYHECSGIGAESATAFAETCADQQEELDGPYSAEWESPSDAADEDMSCWDYE